MQYQKKVARCFVIFFSIVVILQQPVSGQPTVKIMTEPPDTVLRIGAEPHQIWIFPRTNEHNVQFEWKTEGPGEFKFEEGGVGGIYNVPEKIQGSKAQVNITVTITNNTGQTATDSVMFTLKAIAPVPTPTPVPLRIRQVRLTDTANDDIEPTYSVKPGERLTIKTDITKPSDSNAIVKYTSIYGKIVSDQKGATYTAPNKPGGRDIVTVKVVDGKTGKLIIPKIIKIKILDTTQ